MLGIIDPPRFSFSTETRRNTIRLEQLRAMIPEARRRFPGASLARALVVLADSELDRFLLSLVARPELQITRVVMSGGYVRYEADLGRIAANL
jgi:hypothetical protein